MAITELRGVCNLGAAAVAPQRRGKAAVCKLMLLEQELHAVARAVATSLAEFGIAEGQRRERVGVDAARCVVKVAIDCVEDLALARELQGGSSRHRGPLR